MPQVREIARVSACDSMLGSASDRSSGLLETAMSRRSFLGVAACGMLTACGCDKGKGSAELDPRRLQNALEGIRAWLVEHTPDVAHQLQPGLSSKEIETITANVPFALPFEESLLYEWHNGSTSDGPFIFNHRYLPLQEAVEFYRKGLGTGWQTSWFPLFMHKGDAYIVAPFGFKSKQMPIRHFTLQSTESPNVFQNLTAMMETALDWFRSGAVRAARNGTLRPDEDMMRKIFERHNPGLPFPGIPGQ